MRFVAAEGRQPSTNVPRLRSLGPGYVEEQHGRHAAVLYDVLTTTGDDAAKNIALTGHYGSGKSSVILGVQRSLDTNKRRFVNLSLSSLGFDDSARMRLQQDGSVPPLTNLIQKEIVKQLLYRKAPSQMPSSRYFRIDAFRKGPAALWSLVIGIAFLVVTALLGLRGRLEKVAPQGLLEEQADRGWYMLLALGVFASIAWFFGLRTFQNKVRVESVSAGGAALTLKAKENSYFDQYLDEIVYFFQRTKTSIAIFEDLDRFKDPHIFETLRELNTVLNNSDQITSRPVRFVYAVRDSIFEDLDGALTGDDDDADGEEPSRAAALETRPPTNRTKFFDLVIPMVPFLTHRSARDLITEEFEDSPHAPTADVINLVGTHLVDMRLIRNIRNEFEIYSASILAADGLQGLSNDRLFAMLVYKNLHLGDFERIRLGKSQVDDAYRAYRDFVARQTRMQSAVNAEALAQLRHGSAWDTRAQAAGKQLREILPILIRGHESHSNQTQVIHQSSTYTSSELGSSELWRGLQEGQGTLTVANPYSGRIELSVGEVMTLLGNLDLGARVSQDEETLRKRSREALTTRDFLTKASMQELLARSDLLVGHGDGQATLGDITSQLVTPLAYDLLSAGLIDENFTLYCSDYHAVAISVNAMNFILHCVQVREADYLFKFDKDTSIAAVEAERGSRFLQADCVFNVDVFDHYLATEPDKLEWALLQMTRGNSPHASFLGTYLSVGARGDALIAALVRSRWPRPFDYLVGSAELDDDAKVALVSDAFLAAEPDVDYVVTDDVLDFITGTYEQMPCFTQELSDAAAGRLAEVCEGLGLIFNSLVVLGERQRAAVTDRSLYPVTRENIQAAVGQGGPSPLDDLRTLKPAVYAHLVTNIDDYLTALRPGELTVTEPNQFVAVLEAVSGVSGEAVRAVAERGAKACLVADMSEIASAARPGVVAARRFAPSTANVAELAEDLGLTPQLAGAISGVAALTDADKVEPDRRVALAVLIANCGELGSADAIRLIEGLELENYLDVDSLDSVGRSRLAELLVGHVIADELASYRSIADWPFADKEHYFAVAKKLPEYVKDLDLSAVDVAALFKSTRVAAQVKQVLAADSDYLSSALNRQAAIAVAVWARLGHDVTAAVLAVLSEASTPADYVVDLLTPLLPAIDQADLDRILRALGDPYEQLTFVGHHRPKLPKREGTVEMLEELKRRDLVSSYKDTLGGGSLRVSMRH